MMKKRTSVFLLSIVAFVGGLSLTAWVLGLVFVPFDQFVIREKIIHFAKHRNEYDTLFLGSSRVYHQISPAIFDNLTREAGMPTRSFNFGMDGLFPPEDSYIAEHLLSLHPKNLRWVFVEVSLFLPDPLEKNADSPRTVYWHDWTRTSMAVRDILDQSDKFEWKKRKKRWEKWRTSLERCGMHLRMFARNVARMGQGGVLLGNFLKGKQPKRGQGLGARRDGYAPLGSGEGGEAAGFVGYEKQFASRSNKPVQYKPLSRVGQENLDRLLRTIRNAGATPVLVVSPALSAMFVVPNEPARELYLDFADVHSWPQLYRKEHFVDAGHLSKPGAELYTRYLAEGWLAANKPKESDSARSADPATSALDEQTLTP